MRRMVFAGIAVSAAMLAGAAEKLALPAEFETWGKGGEFEIRERSRDSKRNGEYSLHLKDSDAGKHNQTLQYWFPKGEVKRAAGKLLRFTAYVKQVSASKPGVVGVGIWIKDAEGKITALNQGVDSTGETDWLPVTARVAVPENAAQIFVSLNCAHGFGNRGEAYFDDLELVVEDPANPSPLPKAEVKSAGPAAVNSSSASPEEERYRAKYREARVFEDDGKPRPVIENGTWYSNGRPVFFLGPWLYPGNEGSWGGNHNPLNINHIAYRQPPSAEVFREVGFNSGQISGAVFDPGAARYGAPLSKRYQGQEERSRVFFEAFGDMPMVVDFAFGFNKLLAEGNPELARELEQRNGHWHGFIPFCPEHPEGDRYYRDFMIGGVTATLAAGGNPMVWELFNESSYNCQCRFNAATFAEEMKAQYKEISAANRVWGTVFGSFEELKTVTHFEQFRGLWPDWCKYSSRRYAQLLKRYADVIRSVDRRPRVYFTEQLADMHIFQARGAGMDYRLIAGALDMLATEGGWRYGGSRGEGSGGPMEDAAAGGRLKHSFVNVFYRALAKDRKPVMNHEYYCGRFEFDKRVPSRATDFITAMWGEIFHGVSGCYHYVWDKRAWEWRTFEQAKAIVEKPSYKSYSMLNPYNWPPSELDAGKRFVAELEPYRDRLLPMPRITGEEVALFYSYPSLRMQGLNREDFQKKVLNWYSAALYGNYPVRVVFEEELAALSAKVLLLPSATHVIPSMMKDLDAFSKRGGVIVADQGAFRFDEYGHPLGPVNFPVTRLDAADTASIPEVRKLLAAARRPVAVVPADDGGAFHEMEIHLIDRGDFKLALLVNFGDRKPRLAKLSFDLPDQGEFYLVDPVAKRLLTNSSKETWSVPELKRGAVVVIPPQERFLLAFERKRPAAVSAVSQAAMPELLKKQLEACRPELEALEKLANEYRSEREEARMYKGVKTESCVPLDLRKVVNMAFHDEVADDGKGGWFDQGENDFANMPLGRITAAGVPFTIIDPATNDGRSVLTLRGKERPRFPVKAEGIAVGLRAKRLYFLHTSGWTPKTGTVVFTYLIHYVDGTKLEIPVRSGHEIGGWWGTPALTNAKIAVEAANSVKPLVNLQCFRWDNPQPEKEIRSLDILSANGEGVPAIVAITAER